MKKPAETFKEFLDRTDRELLHKRVNLRHFGGVIAIAALLGLQSFLHAFGCAQVVRRRTFPKQWMLDNFEAHHKRGLENEEAEYPYMGYPDSGAGIYARKLAYKDWFEFNCA